MQPSELRNLETQVKVSRMLSYGFVFSILGLGGIASVIALVLGLRARKIIRQFEGELAGIKMAWWCIITGFLGALILPPLGLWTVMRYLR